MTRICILAQWYGSANGNSVVLGGEKDVVLHNYNLHIVYIFFLFCSCFADKILKEKKKKTVSHIFIS